MPLNIKQLLKRSIRSSLVPPDIAARQRHLTALNRAKLMEVLREHYFSQPLNYFGPTPLEYLQSEEGRQDMENHVEGRISVDRDRVIPWLASARPLAGTKILEIGCGTGASTVTLAEQGALVTAVDVNEGNLNAAKKRLDLYGLNARFLRANATDLHRIFGRGDFDMIVFFATLEHLTHQERMTAMRGTWSLLVPGGLWGCVETPNRLWWFDDHTALLPFFNWLPDDVAMDYAPQSARPFMKNYSSTGDSNMRMDFARRGRGVSYHEFDLTLGPSTELDVVSSLNTHIRSKSFPLRLKHQLSKDREYEGVLRSRGPDIHAGFYQPYLDLLIRRGA